MVKITFYGGVGEIGGNKILVETAGARLFLDFGQAFKQDDRYYTTFLRPRGLADYLRLGLVDPVPGVYSKSALEDSGVPHTEKPAVDAVVLSHVHHDHVAHLKYLRGDIPVYIGAATFAMLASWETTTPGIKFGAVAKRTRKAAKPIKGAGVEDGIDADSESEKVLPIPERFPRFRTGDRFNIGDVEVEPIHVDHSTPAAYGMLLHTPEGTIAYTGDLRRHGPKAQMTQDFIDRAKVARPIALICEGTRVGPGDSRQDLSEQGVSDAVDKLLVTHPSKLITTTFYARDVDRIITYASLAANHGRIFAVSGKVAHLLDALEKDNQDSGKQRIVVPHPHADPHMAIYVRNKKRVFGWEKDLEAKGGRVVDSDEVHANQGQFILHLDFSAFGEFLDIRPDPGSVFVNSMSEPFTEEDIADDVKDNWLNFLHMDRHQAHASGHAPMKDIFAIANEINAPVVMPVHTEHPAMFTDNVTAKVIVPVRGNTIQI